MTQLLQRAWDAVMQIPENKQDYIASLILDELEDESLWEKQFSTSQQELSKIAGKVREEIRQGKVKESGFGEI